MSRTVSGWLRTTAATGTSRSASAMAAVRSPVAAVGRTSTIIASTSSSAASSSRHCRKSAPETAAVVSTGPLTVPPGSRARSLRLVWATGWWTASPRSAPASAVSTPAPPTLDTIATVPPAGTGWVASSAVTSVSSPRPGLAARPTAGRVENLRRNALEFDRDIETEDGVGAVRHGFQLSGEGGIEEGARVANGDPLADAERAARPSGIDQPTGDAVLQQARFQHFAVGIGMAHHERAAEAGAEGDFRFRAQADLGAGDLAGIPGKEVVDGLFGREPDKD